MCVCVKSKYVLLKCGRVSQEIAEYVWGNGRHSREDVKSIRTAKKWKISDGDGTVNEIVKSGDKAVPKWIWKVWREA